MLLDESLFKAIPKRKLKEKKWEHKIDKDLAFRLRDILEDDDTDYEALREVMKDIYDNIHRLIPDMFDEYECENAKEDLDMLDTEDYGYYGDEDEDEDPVDVEDSWNYELSNLYDICDTFNIWIPIRSLDESTKSKKKVARKAIKESAVSSSIREEVYDVVYDIVADSLDNLALAVHASIPKYNPAWCADDILVGSHRHIEDFVDNLVDDLFYRADTDKVHESYDKDGNHETCEECGALLTDAGECPKCDLGDERMNEARLSDNEYELTFYANSAGAERRPGNRRDFDRDWIVDTFTADNDLDACKEAFEQVYDMSYDEYLDEDATVEDFIEYFEDADWSDGSPIIIKLRRKGNVLYDSGYTKAQWKQAFFESYLRDEKVSIREKLQLNGGNQHIDSVGQIVYNEVKKIDPNVEVVTGDYTKVGLFTRNSNQVEQLKEAAIKAMAKHHYKPEVVKFKQLNNNYSGYVFDQISGSEVQTEPLRMGEAFVTNDSDKDAYIKTLAQDTYESGQPYSSDDFKLFRRIGREDGYELTQDDFDRYFEYLDNVGSDMNESNSITNELPESVDQFLMDIAQTTNAFDYNDVSKFAKRATEEDIKKLKNLRRKWVRNAEMMEDDEVEAFGKKVASIIK